MPAPSTRPVIRSGSFTVTIDAESAGSGQAGRSRASPVRGGTVQVDADLDQAPPEILRFCTRGLSGDYYQALSTAAAMRLRLLGTLHARSEITGPAAREAARRRLEAQRRQAWEQLQWLVAEMRRLDEDSRR